MVEGCVSYKMIISYAIALIVAVVVVSVCKTIAEAIELLYWKIKGF